MRLRIHILLWALCHQELLQKVAGRSYCHWSHQSAEIVNSCPKTIHQMENRAKMKNCESMARVQNCTAQQKFKYHCVMNELENTFVEVCAEEYIIHGYCTEYNTGGAVVQPHYELKCSDVIPPCKSSYNSTDAYLYRGCFDIVTNRTRGSSTTVVPDIQTENMNNKQSTENRSNDEIDETILISTIISLCLITTVGIASYVLCRKRATMCKMYFVEKSKHRKEGEQSLDFVEKTKHRKEEEHILGKSDTNDCSSEDTSHLTVKNV